MPTDREKQLRELVSAELKLEALEFGGDSPVLAIKLREEIDAKHEQLRPSPDEIDRAKQAVSDECEKAKRREQLEQKFQTIYDQYLAIGRRLERLENILGGSIQSTSSTPAQPGPSPVKPRSSWKALFAAASAILFASAVLVLPFLLLLLNVPMDLAGVQTRAIEISLDIGALVAAILGGGGIAAAGIAYAAQQLRSLESKEHGPES